MAAGASLTCISLMLTGFFASVLPNPFEINKCCPENKMLNLHFECVDLDPEGREVSKDLGWFPVNAIVDAKTMEKGRGRSPREYLDLIKQKYRINYGEMPNCGDNDTRQMSPYSPDVVDFFNYIADEDGTLRVHVSKPSSLHYPELRTLFFSDVPRDKQVLAGLLRNGKFPSYPARLPTGGNHSPG